MNKDRIVAEFIELVETDSLTFKERKIADLLLKKLQELGLEAYEDKAGEHYNGEAGNVIGKLAGNAEGPTLLFAAHMDRVEPGTGIKAKVEESIIKSEGETILGGDNCAGIVAILEALRVLKEQKDTYSNIEVVFTIAEEGGLFGAKFLDMALLKAKMAYTLDSQGDTGTMVMQAPAQDEIKIIVRGKASHAGVAPEEGVNAIGAASLAISKLKMGRIDKETTSNVGVISGGKATNVVPDHVLVMAETRSLVEKRVDEETAKMKDVFEKSAKSLGAQVEFKNERVYSAYKIGEDDPAAQRCLAALERIGAKPDLVALNGGSDANILNAKGISCINLGNGTKKVHTKEEELAIEDLIDAARLCHALMLA